MHDWSGSRIRQDALSVVCPYCHAVIGAQCVSKADGRLLDAFPAHTVRIKAATTKEPGECQ